MLKRIPFILAIITLLAVFFSPTLAQQTGSITFIFRMTFSSSPSMSEDGRYIAFISNDYITFDDHNNQDDVFVYDRELNTLVQISHGYTGNLTNGHSANARISADGRLVAFQSDARNLVPNDTNLTTDIFVYDRKTAQTTRVSVSSTGEQANGRSVYPVISGDGRYVAFTSEATNLVPGDTNNSRDVFVHDRQTGQTSIVSVTSSGQLATGNTHAYLDMSRDGRYVAFVTTGQLADVAGLQGYVHDRQTAQTHRITRRYTDGGAVAGLTTMGSIAISDDGRYVAFASNGKDHAPNDFNDKTDVFLYDRLMDETRFVSERAGVIVNDNSQTVRMSGDGAYIVFTSHATNLIPNDTNNSNDAFLYTVATNTIEVISITPTGVLGNNNTNIATISDDGNWLALSSRATNFTSYNGVSAGLFLKQTVLPNANPNAPTLIAPVANDNTTNADVTFSWDSTAHATDYRLQIALDANFTNVVYDQADPNTSATVNLAPTVYYWRVRGKNGLQNGTWSEARMLSRSLTPISLIAPVDMTTSTQATQSFTWDSVPNATSYQFQLALDSNFNTLRANVSRTEPNMNYEFVDAGVYYWRVRPQTDMYTGAWSTPRQVTITPLSAPSLIAPADMMTDTSAFITFSWDAVPDATGYLIKISDNSSFSTLLYEQNVTETNYTGLFLNSGTYYWRVFARAGSSLLGTPSAIRQFDLTIASPPSLLAPVDMATLATADVTFTWDDIAIASSYTIEIATNASFTQLVGLQDQLTTPTYTASGLFSQSRDYYWRVWVVLSDTTQMLLPAKQFTLELFPPPTLLTPTHQSTYTTSNLTFTWDVVAGATRYDIQISGAHSASANNLTTNAYTTAIVHSGLVQWRVRAVSDDYVGVWSDLHTVTFDLFPAPTPIAPADITSTTNPQVTLSWEAVVGATNYVLQISPNSTFTSGVTAITLANTSHQLTLPDAGVYYWRVQSSDGILKSNWSPTYQLTIAPLPPPTLVAPADMALITDLIVTFDWDAVTDANTYQIVIATDSALNNVVFTTTNTATLRIQNFTSQGTYYWAVRALRAGIHGTWSEVRQFTLDIAYLTPPTLFTPFNGEVFTVSDVTFTWEENFYATGYHVQIAANSSFNNLLFDFVTETNSHSRSFAVADTYYWRVRPLRDTVQGSWSQTRSFIIDNSSLSGPTLIAPADGTITQNPEFVFSWHPVAEATGYQIQVGEGVGFNIIRESEITTDTTIMLALSHNNKNLYWRVRAMNGDLLGGWSDAWLVRLNSLDIVTMVSPVNGTQILAPTGGEVTFNWNPVPYAVEYRIDIATHYNFSASSLIESVFVPDTSYTTTLPPTLLTFPQQHYWRVLALSQTHSSTSSSNPWGFVIGTLPAPALVSPASMTTTTTSQTTFTWDEVPGATSYNITIYSHPSLSGQTISNTGTTTSFTTLITSAGTKYWRVRAFDALGVGLWSEVREITYDALPAPNLISPINIILDNETVTFTWDAIPNATHYDVEVKRGTIDYGGRVYTNSYTKIMPLSGVFQWRVKASNGSLVGFESEWQEFTIQVLPTPILGAPADNILTTNTTITFTWEPVAGATGYNIRASTNPQFSPNLFLEIVTGTSYTTTFIPGTTYYWSVSARKNNTSASLFQTRQFTVLPLYTPMLIAPSNLATLYNEDVVFSWHGVADTLEYNIQIGTDLTFNTLLHDAYITDTTYNQTFDSGNAYYWRVRRLSIYDDWSGWSQGRRFTVNPLPAPTLLTPADSTSTTDASVNFTWDAIAEATSYQVQIATDASFVVVLYDHIKASNNHTQPFTTANTYYWRVRGIKGTGNGDWSVIQTVTIQPPPAPTLLTPVDMMITTTPQTTFTWDAVAGATEYRIQIATDDTFTQLVNDQTISTTAHSYTATGLGTHYWRVRANKNTLVGTWSDVRHYTINPLPAPTLLLPLDFMTTPLPQVTFTWDAVADATEYQIQVSANSGFTAIVHDQPVSTTTHTYTAVAIGGHYWRVRAKQGSLNGTWSAVNEYQILPLAAPVLIDPAQMTTTANPDLSFIWDAVTDATSYQIQISTNSGFTAIVYDANPTINGHSQFVAGIGVYYWRVRAKIGTLNGIWSQTRQFTLETPPAPAPNLIAPVDMSFTYENSITFSWDVLPHVTDYQIQISTDSAFSTFMTNQIQTATTFTRNFSNAGIYYWRVRGKNVTLDGAWTATHQFTIEKLPPPSLIAPADLHTTTQSSFPFSWTPVDGATSYIIHVSNTPDFSANVSSGDGVTTARQMQLRLGVNYWRVLARKGQLNGEWSEVRQIILNPLPAPVQLSPAINAETTHIVTLAWEPVELATRYFVEFSPTHNDITSVEITPTSRIYSLPMVMQTQTIMWRVKAGDWGANEGAWSEWRPFDLRPVGIPQIINPLHNANSGQSPIDQTVQFSWGGVFRATSYRMQISTTSNMNNIIYDETLANTTQTLHLDDGTYFWRVRGENVTGFGYWTQTAKFTVAPLPAPTNLRPTNTPLIRSYIVPFTWDAVPNATQYQLQISHTSGYFTTIVFDTTVTSPATSLTFPAGTSVTFWRVRAINANGETSVWSNERFYIYIATNLIAPQNMAIIFTPTVELSWEGNDNIDEYQVQVATDNTFTSLIADRVVTSTNTTQTVDMVADYYWRVRAVLSEDEDTWSEVRQFTVDTLITSQEINEQALFNAMMTNLSDAFQFAIMDARPDGIMTTLQFTDGTVANVMVNMSMENGLILITLSDIVIQGGGTQAQLDALYQDVPVMMMATLNALLPDDYVSIQSLTINDVGISIEVIGGQP